MQRPDPLIRTKLRPPFTRTELVSRPQLQARIADGLSYPLTLVIAPAGFGKTTLVATSLAGVRMPVAWLSLDQEDNQTGRFLAYLVAALQGVDNRIGSEAALLMGKLQQEPHEAVMTSLLNDLDSLAQEIVLVLDDYQFVNSPAVHEQVAFLLEHCPANLHLLIASRSDPALPLARLRARGQMAELRTSHLRFTLDEATSFLNDLMGLRLDADLVKLLENRTEGWIAGLKMAALTMRDREDVAAFIEGFSGTNRYILDYLLEEVLARQPADIQRFLLSTSILERLSAPLCDAVLSEESQAHLPTASPAQVPGKPQSTQSFTNQPINQSQEEAARSTNQPSSITQWLNDPVTKSSTQSQGEAPRWPNDPVAQSSLMLEYLERANLFLVPLDDERVWYRYHHLFASLLRARLAQLESGGVQSLHQRAASWYWQKGFYEDAIHHALAAVDYPLAAQMIEDQAETVWLKAEYSRIMDWVKALPMDLVRSRPWLCIWHAWSINQVGLLNEARTWIDIAEQAVQKSRLDLSTTPESSHEIRALEYEIATLRAHLACLGKDYDSAIQLASRVLENPPSHSRKSSQVARCHVLHGLGSMYYAVGELDKAEEVSQATIQAAREIGFYVRHIHSLNKLAYVYLTRGQLHDCHHLLQEAMVNFRRQGLDRYSVLHVLRCRLADLLYEWNRLGDIESLIQDYRLSGDLIDVPYVRVDLYNLQARQLLMKNDLHGAQSALDQAATLIQDSYIWPALTRQAESLQVRLWLRAGDTPRIIAWAKEPLEKDTDRFPFLSEFRQIARARIFLQQKEYEQALDLLGKLGTLANSGGRQGSLVMIRTLEAIALQAEGHPWEARTALDVALGLAEKEGYTRTFLDEGQSMQNLLGEWLAHAGAGPLRDYARYLLSQFDAEPHQESPAREKPTQVSDLVEPLSQRELEVLSHLALGRTNQEIARQLFVSPGTVKAHTASIYRKLDVANRTEAVARARVLGILI